MISEKYKDIEDLKKIALKQNNKLNLSVILITLKCAIEDIPEITTYFEESGIEIINEDVEPEAEDENSDRRVIPFDPLKIDIKMDKITIDSIIKRIKNNEMKFDSSFQRKSGLWNRKQKSQLIESIFLKIPLPAFYFDASDDDEWQIIDGLQRIGTIKEFVFDNGFALSGLEFLKDFDGLKFKELPRSMQRRIEETNLNAYLVNPSTPKNVKYNIFKRINTGGLVLEPQEIRNALYQGKATDILLSLSKDKAFIEATDNSIKTDRMLDREFCLRYVVFTQFDIEEKYVGGLEEFLNSGMDYLSNISDDQFERIKNGFERTMNICKRIFGKFAFRRLNTEARRGPVNKALFETWSFIISNSSDEDAKFLEVNKNIVMEKFTELCDDYTFQNAIRAADKTSVKTRIKLVSDLVEAIKGESSL